jgi:hypothetical protein
VFFSQTPKNGLLGLEGQQQGLNAVVSVRRTTPGRRWLNVRPCEALDARGSVFGKYLGEFLRGAAMFAWRQDVLVLKHASLSSGS